VGKASVVYSKDLGLWLMTFNGGKHTSDAATGLYFTYATKPWGPWQSPQLIYNDCANQGYGHYIHYAGGYCNESATGPAGPTDAGGNPLGSNGEGFGPYMIEPFMTVANGTLTIYFTMSTWNPYTVLKMRSDFKITNP
jgi:hypothetical protein